MAQATFAPYLPIIYLPYYLSLLSLFLIIILLPISPGHPLPVVSWHKDTECVDDSLNVAISHNNGHAELSFEELYLEDEGTYRCTATNCLGSASTSTDLSILGEEVVNY